MSHTKASYFPVFNFNEPSNQIHVLVHNLNDTSPIIVVFDTAIDQQIYPTPQVITANILQLTFADPTAIRGVIVGNS